MLKPLLMAVCLWFDLQCVCCAMQVRELFTHAFIVGRNFPICHVRIDGLLVEVASIQPANSLPSSANALVHSSRTTGPFKVQGFSHSRPHRGSSSQGVGPPRDAAALAKQLLQQQEPWQSAPTQLLQLQSHPPWNNLQLQQQLPLQQKLSQQPPPPPRPIMTWTQARRANARSRDFTVNALLYDPFTLLLYDYVGGMEDLEHGVVRCVRGNPSKSLQQDPARILRAIRCASRTGGCWDR
jgi:hypothetical protein